MNFKKMAAVAVLLATFVTSQAFAVVTYTTTIHAGPYAIGGKTRMVTGHLVLSGTYATNGFALNAKDFGLVAIQSASLQPVAGEIATYNGNTGLMKLYQQAQVTGSVGAATINLTSGTTGTAVYYSGGSFYTSGGGSISLPVGSFTGGASGLFTELTAGQSVASQYVNFVVTGI